MIHILKYFIPLLIIGSTIVYGQVQINNIKTTQTDDEILIEYDLIAEEKEEYEIKLFLMRESVPGFKYPVLGAKGDVGKIVFSKGKKVIRYPLDNSYVQFNPEIEDFYFQIEVYEISMGIPWYYYALGGVLTGGVAAVLLLINNNSEEAPQVTIGAPPVRP